MKNTKDIICRAILLLVLADRHALEYSVIEGKKHSKRDREKQQARILGWLEKHRYTDFMTKDEYSFLYSDIGSVDRDETYEYQMYEGIEPCLWSVKLVDSLSDYNSNVTTDFHPILIGVLDDLVSKSNLRDIKSIQRQCEIAMLWHWRSLEQNYVPNGDKNLPDVVESIFGTEHKALVNEILHGHSDFLVNYQPYSQLNPFQKLRTQCISEWRHLAFEWIVGDDAWDEVDTTT